MAARENSERLLRWSYHQQSTTLCDNRSTEIALLFDPVQLGSLVLANRVFMAPLTRTRAHGDAVPSKLAATYYSQRASAGLIVTEATQISPYG